MKKNPARLISAACALAACLFSSACERRESRAPEKVTVAVAALPDTALVQVAHARGLFREQGVDATLQRHEYGKIALRAVLDGKADIATVAEVPIMFAVLEGEKISVVATIMSSNSNHVVIARKDRGIASFGDLKGKRVAMTRGTTSDFFLHAVLSGNGISESEVEAVDLKAEAIPEALANGEVDAASAFLPYSLAAEKKLGENALVLRDRDAYRYTFNLVAREDFVRRHPDRVARMLKSLLQAEEYARQNPEAAQRVVAEFVRLDPETLRSAWPNARFSVTLDQTLLLALEDESEWAIRNGLTKASKVPNFLDSIYLDGLKSLKPSSVGILR